MTSKGIARKAYFIITFVITLPLCITFYYFSQQQKTVILMENERELTRIAVTLAQRLPQNGKPLVYWGDNFKKDTFSPQKISDISMYYQPFVDELATIYPYYRIGIYHRNMESMIAVDPSTPTPDFIFHDRSAMIKVFETGEPVSVTIADSKFDQVPTLVSLSPIYHLGKVVGITWYV